MFDFFARPVAIEGDGKVERLIVERTRLDASGTAVGTGETYAIPCGMVIAAIGYKTTPIPGVPYDDKLARFAEVLGSVHYLRTLCKAPGGDEWRNSMQQLLDSETGNEPQRKEKLTAAFNRGYRAFASVYTDCTPAAIVAEERYRNEGATLATEITSRFGN
jgi:uncharacterized protein (TIGR02301 family)